MKKQTKQAYRQKPWRIQTQWISLTLLVVVLAILSIAMNLTITTKSAHAGVQVRVLEAEREKLERSISGNLTLLAQILSASTMQERAKEMGYVPATQANIEYIYLSEYVGKEGQKISIPPARDNAVANSIKPIYTRSLWDWVFDNTFTMLDREGK
ncbi:MAG: hypothetical protein BGO78_17535 [Chloroflexi bacterium 44-23]|nr:MAG: hypothetical protein BGO78_17535 [Chloroflexi bacterium 44-23]